MRALACAANVRRLTRETSVWVALTTRCQGAVGDHESSARYNRRMRFSAFNVTIGVLCIAGSVVAFQDVIAFRQVALEAASRGKFVCPMTSTGPIFAFLLGCTGIVTFLGL